MVEARGGGDEAGGWHPGFTELGGEGGEGHSGRIETQACSTGRVEVQVYLHLNLESDTKLVLDW